MTTCPRAKEKGWKGIFQIRRGKSTGLERRPEFISWNKHSGASAINIAYHLGAKTVVLVAFDMKNLKGDDKHNWHDYHHTVPISDIYTSRFMKVYPNIKRDAKILKVNIINANPDSGLNYFPKMTLEEAVERYGT